MVGPPGVLTTDQCLKLQLTINTINGPTSGKLLSRSLTIVWCTFSSRVRHLPTNCLVPLWCHSPKGDFNQRYAMSIATDLKSVS